MGLGTNDAQAGGGGGPLSMLSTGAALLGFAPNDVRLGMVYTDFEANPNPAGWTAGGTVAPADVAGNIGGVSRLSSGAGAGNNSTQQTTSRIVGLTSTSKWYFAWRFRLASTIDVNHRVFLGLSDNGNNSGIFISASGGHSPTNFVYDHGAELGTGSFVDSGVPADANFHIGEMWGVGDTKFHARMDSGAEITPTVIASPFANNNVFCQAFNNGVAVNCIVDRDWCLYLFTGRMP